MLLTWRWIVFLWKLRWSWRDEYLQHCSTKFIVTLMIFRGSNKIHRDHYNNQQKIEYIPRIFTLKLPIFANSKGSWSWPWPWMTLNVISSDLSYRSLSISLSRIWLYRIWLWTYGRMDGHLLMVLFSWSQVFCTRSYFAKQKRPKNLLSHTVWKRRLE